MTLNLDLTIYSFNMLNWSGYKWRKKEPWGIIHPDKAWNYYDESAVEIDDEGILHLKTHFNPITIKQESEK